MHGNTTMSCQEKLQLCAWEYIAACKRWNIVYYI